VGFPGLPPRPLPRVAHTHALFADQSHSNPDNLVALLSQSRAWNCSVQTGHRGSCDARATTNPAAEPDGAAAQERPAMRAAQIEQNVAAHELLGTGPVAKPSLGTRSSDQFVDDSGFVGGDNPQPAPRGLLDAALTV